MSLVLLEESSIALLFYFYCLSSEKKNKNMTVANGTFKKLLRQ